MLRAWGERLLSSSQLCSRTSRNPNRKPSAAYLLHIGLCGAAIQGLQRGRPRQGRRGVSFPRFRRRASLMSPCFLISCLAVRLTVQKPMNSSGSAGSHGLHFWATRGWGTEAAACTGPPPRGGRPPTAAAVTGAQPRRGRLRPRPLIVARSDCAGSCGAEALAAPTASWLIVGSPTSTAADDPMIGFQNQPLSRREGRGYKWPAAASCRPADRTLASRDAELPATALRCKGLSNYRMLLIAVKN